MNLANLRSNVASNVGDPGMVQFTADSINTSIQEGYGLICAATLCIEKSQGFPQVGGQVYYDFAASIGDFLCLAALFNYNTNRWLIPADRGQFRDMRWDWELQTGEPIWFDQINYRYTCVVPANKDAVGGFLVFYKAAADILTDNTVPSLPMQLVKCIENYATMDQLVLAQEFSKCTRYYKEFIADIPKIRRLALAKASADRVNISTPNYSPDKFASSGAPLFVNNETPVGTIDGTNSVFTLAKVPNPTASLLMTLNGAILYQGIGYILVGALVYMQTGYVPQVGDALRAWYQV